MSDATDLRTYILANMRTQLLLETIEWDDETATALDADSNTRLDLKCAEAIIWTRAEIDAYDPTNYPIHQVIAAYVTMWLLYDHNELTEEASKFASRADKLIESFKSRRRVAPIAASGYVRSTAPTTRPMFDQEAFTGWIPPSPSSTEDEA